jgi:hypothetical protein
MMSGRRAGEAWTQRLAQEADVGKLPNNSIGISDILDYRECPQRHAWSMRRHWPLPERLQLEPNELDVAPEKTNWTNAYGSAVHDCIHEVEQGRTHKEAIEIAMQRYGTYLEPGDITMLREDLQTYERRRPLGVTLVGSEMELRVPLFVHEGEQIYFRFRLDVLQRLISNPGVFVHRDYKSSKWRKTPAEVHSDLQLWAYNWAIHEFFPECQHLVQTYDQLRYGEEKTTKNDEQRAAMKQWLIDNVRIILADDTYKPKVNDFCRYCPMIVTCREPRRAVRYWRGRLHVLAPMTKEGRKVKVEFFEEGEELEQVIRDELPAMIQTRKHIEHVEELLKDDIANMPEEERQRLGWKVSERKTRRVATPGVRELHEAMGDRFYEMVPVSLSRVQEFAGKGSTELEIAARWATEEVSGRNISPAKSGG